MSAADHDHAVAHGMQRRRAPRNATIWTVLGATFVASLLYEMTGSWAWTSTVATASDGTPLTEVQLRGAASGWGEIVVLLFGVAAWVSCRNPAPPGPMSHSRGVGRSSADRVIRWMWLYIAGVWVFSILQGVVAVFLVQHQIVPSFLINGTVHLRHF